MITSRIIIVVVFYNMYKSLKALGRPSEYFIITAVVLLICVLTVIVKDIKTQQQYLILLIYLKRGIIYLLN